VGVASTATVHNITLNGVSTTAVFVGGGDGYFYALNAATGAVIWKTSLGSSPSHFLWSSPLFWNGGIYEGIASFGDCPLVRGGIWKLSATTGKVWHRFWTAPSGCTGAAVWGSPAHDPATGNIFFGTGNGGSCGSGEPLSVALIEVTPTLSLVSRWQVPSSQQVSDSDFGSTPTMFSADIHGTLTNMVGLANKDGIYYAFDRSAISSGPLWHRRISVGGPGPQGGKADISPSAWDGTHLYAADGATIIGGVSCKGTVQSLNPATGVPIWRDCLQGGTVLGAVTEVPGVLFIGDGTYFQAIDATTGGSLFSYQDTSAGSNFWGAASISNGIAYIGNQDGTLYAFGT
jgi:polyvinyl alcohol dehydrogenase (cytochrome)